MKCDICKKEIDDVLEKVELAFGDELIIVRNNPETPVCVDCMYDAFEETLNGIIGD